MDTAEPGGNTAHFVWDKVEGNTEVLAADIKYGIELKLKDISMQRSQSDPTQEGSDRQALHTNTHQSFEPP